MSTIIGMPQTNPLMAELTLEITFTIIYLLKICRKTKNGDMFYHFFLQNQILYTLYTIIHKKAIAFFNKLKRQCVNEIRN